MYTLLQSYNYHFSYIVKVNTVCEKFQCRAFDHVLMASLRLFTLLTTENYPVSLCCSTYIQMRMYSLCVSRSTANNRKLNMYN